jgi:hypothetical protein
MQAAVSAAVESGPVREPPITLTCDCGAGASVPYGERWTCPQCGKTWDTNQIPRAEYDALLSNIRRYRLLVFVPALSLAVVLVPLAVLVDVRFAYLLFVLEMAFALMVVPPLRRRASLHVLAESPSWRLSPE